MKKKMYWTCPRFQFCLQLNRTQEHCISHETKGLQSLFHILLHCNIIQYQEHYSKKIWECGRVTDWSSEWTCESDSKNNIVLNKGKKSINIKQQINCLWNWLQMVRTEFLRLIKFWWWKKYTSQWYHLNNKICQFMWQCKKLQLNTKVMTEDTLMISLCWRVRIFETLSLYKFYFSSFIKELKIRNYTFIQTQAKTFYNDTTCDRLKAWMILIKIYWLWNLLQGFKMNFQDWSSSLLKWPK